MPARAPMRCPTAAPNSDMAPIANIGSTVSSATA
jgi:hypothetical protein